MKASYEWRKCKLDELGFVGRGKSRHRPRNESSLYGGTHPFFQTGDIKAANLYMSNYSQTYSDKGLAQSKKWNPGTLCITIAANIADTAILGVQGCFPDSVVGFVADENKADVRFVKYHIDILKLSMQSVSKGTTQDNLSLDKLLAFDFHVPPLSIQHRIAGILSAYDDLIENNLRRIKILEEMACRLYREWFINFRFPGHENIRLVDSPVGKIPEGWEAKSLRDIAHEERRGVSPVDLDTNTPYVGLEHIPRRTIALTEWGTASEVRSDKLAFTRGEILFGKIRPYFHKVVVAPIDGVCSTDAIVIVPNDESLFALTLAVVSSDDFVAHSTQSSNGTKMPRANWNLLLNYPIAVPNKQIMKRFTGLIRNSVDQIEKLIFANRNLRSTRDLLLPRLMSDQGGAV